MVTTIRNVFKRERSHFFCYFDMNFPYTKASKHYTLVLTTGLFAFGASCHNWSTSEDIDVCVVKRRSGTNWFGLIEEYPTFGLQLTADPFTSHTRTNHWIDHALYSLFCWLYNTCRKKRPWYFSCLWYKVDTKCSHGGITENLFCVSDSLRHLPTQIKFLRKYFLYTVLTIHLSTNWHVSTDL